MKKTEEYLEELFEEPFNLEEGNIEYDFYKIIKEAQEDAIRETVKECAKNAKVLHYPYRQMLTGQPSYFVDENSILSVADKLIEEL